MDMFLAISLRLTFVWLAATGENDLKHLYDSIPCTPCICSVIPNKGIVANCASRSLETIPSTVPRSVTHLLLHNNFISDVYPHLGGFLNVTYLDLSSNKINKTLHIDTFVNNTKLETLNLNDNDIELTNTAYPKGLFRNQINLVSLDISKNVVDANSSYPDETLGDLVSLQALKADGLMNAIFGNGFSNLKHLRNLKLSGNRGHCHIQQLYNQTFTHMPNLQFLDISKCFLLDIEKSAFQPLRKIDTLIISDNRLLGIERLAQYLYGLQYSSIRVIDASSIVAMYAIGVELKVEHVAYLNNTKLTHLKFDYNRLELIHNMVPMYLTHLESLSIEGNRFIFGSYIVSSDPMKKLKKIIANNQFPPEDIFHAFDHILFRGQRIVDTFQLSPLSVVSTTGNMITSFGDTITDNKNVNTRYNKLSIIFRIPVPPSLSYINVSSSGFAYHIAKENFYDNVIKTIDLSNNVLSKWYGPISPLDHLEFLDMTNNYCDYISADFFHSAFNLLTLNISQNHLSASLANDISGEIFTNLSKLINLKINHNGLIYLPSLIFQNLDNLVILDLSWNILSTWEPDIRHMEKLQVLDLSGNQFEEIPKKLRNDIDVIKKDNHAVYIHIRNNSLKCNCRTMESLQWMLHSEVNFTDIDEISCQFENQTSVSLSNLKETVTQLQLRCNTIVPMLIGVSSGLVILVAISIVGIVYRYRWKLRYLYYTTRRKYRGYQKLTEDEDNYTYDAFVSYADEDRKFVVDDMRNMLEKNFGQRLCIHHRDFMVGQAITDNIINAIQSSRRTVVILSPNFLKSTWCKYEVNMARFEGIYTGRDVLCVVLYADVPDKKDIPNDLLEEISTGTYLTYTVENEGQVLFWQSLRDAISH